jgi:UDPglucose--hexose-1-phosphate uridylyltransferase
MFSLRIMHLRKDPITRSWVITGDDPFIVPKDPRGCPFCVDSKVPIQVVASQQGIDGTPWSARAVVHPQPIFHVEGDPQRSGEGLYDKMQSVGAHEILVENPKHDKQLWDASDAQVEQFLLLIASRILDLKRDPRFKYVTAYKNHGPSAGQDFDHPVAELTATTFVPRRILYELRAGKEYFQQKERCVFCDILAQEQRQALRIVEVRGDYISLCPYAPRVPYEVWIVPRTHEASFERGVTSRQAGLKDLAALLRRTLRRVLGISDAFHLVLHTSPNTLHRNTVLGYWKTIDDDYHWHIEIMPVLPGKAKSYTFKEVYFTPVSSETAASRLREIPVE